MACNVYTALISGLGFGCVDIALTLLFIYFHSEEPSFEEFKNQFRFYSFFSSTVEFLGLAVVRLVFLLLGPIDLLFQAQPQFIMSKTCRLVYSTALLLFAYSPTKLLALTEDRSVLPVGDYFIIIWNFIASFVLCRFWASVYSKVISCSSSFKASK